MAGFKLGDIFWDRLQYGYAESISDGTPLYVLSQLQDTTINTTAEAKEVKDAQGNLIKKIWQTKAATLDGQHALVNTNIVAAASGSDPVFATEGNEIIMPKITTVKKGETLSIADAVEGTIRVNAYEAGSLGDAYTLGTAASATEFAVADGTLTVPTAEGIEEYIVRYNRKVTEGVKIQNRIDKFPKSVRLILKGLYYDPCEKDVLRGGYIEIPSFQLSPEVNLPFQTDATLDYNGDLEVDYCAADKVLYNMYLAADDEED